MRNTWVSTRLGALAAALFLLGACAPAATPSPTTAPAPPAAQQTAPTTAPAKPAAATNPTAQPAAQPSEKSRTAARADTQALEEFYAGKTMRIVVGAAAGGGFDAYSRLIARNIGKYIPGNSTVIVENMPGAGFLKAANYGYNVAPKDGTVIININASGLSVQQLLGKPGVEFDASKFHYVGVPTTDTSLCVATKASGLQSLAETIGPNGKEFIVGGSAPGNSIEDDPSILRESLEANIEIIPGYEGTSKVRLAMDQGEVQGLCGWSWESVKTSSLDRIQSGEYVIVSQNVEKAHKDLPDVPVAYAMAKTDEARKLFHYGFTLMSHVQRQYALPAGVPPERVQLLREAFAKTMTDQEFLAEAEKSKLQIDPLSGEETQDLITELMDMPADIQAKMKKIWRL